MKVIFTSFLITLNFTIQAFTISSTSSNLNKIQNRYNTVLHADDGQSNVDTEAKPESDDGASNGGANDILNSPAFLKRKLEVLQSDLNSVDEKMSAVNSVYEENKAEWGPQLDELRKEVR